MYFLSFFFLLSLLYYRVQHNRREIVSYTKKRREKRVKLKRQTERTEKTIKKCEILFVYVALINIFGEERRKLINTQREERNSV